MTYFTFVMKHGVAHILGKDKGDAVRRFLNMFPRDEAPIFKTEE